MTFKFLELVYSHFIGFGKINVWVSHETVLWYFAKATFPLTVYTVSLHRYINVKLDWKRKDVQQKVNQKVKLFNCVSIFLNNTMTSNEKNIYRLCNMYINKK